MTLSTPSVMGILNATPDSFNEESRVNSVNHALNVVEKMLIDGAAIIDIGGESTRPGAEAVSLEDEINRTIPVIKEINKHFPECVISIDTMKYEVAQQALDVGAKIVNDVSGLRFSPNMGKLVNEFNATYVLMHSIGNSQTMQKNPHYEDVVEVVNQFFEEKIALLKADGVNDIILDPGIGFGKTLAHNLALVKAIPEFKRKGFKVLMGISRKRMIADILDGRETNGRLAGTIAMHYECLRLGADIIRAHDVKEAVDSLKVYKSLYH